VDTVKTYQSSVTTVSIDNRQYALLYDIRYFVCRFYGRVCYIYRAKTVIFLKCFGYLYNFLYASGKVFTPAAVS